MKTNTVILDLEEYQSLQEELLELKKENEVLKNGGVIISNLLLPSKIYTKDEYIKKDIEAKKSLQFEYDKECNRVLIFENMSILDFIKFKLRKK